MMIFMQDGGKRKKLQEPETYVPGIVLFILNVTSRVRLILIILLRRRYAKRCSTISTIAA